MESFAEEKEAPIITYLNRLQKQMFFITTMFSDHEVGFTNLAAPIRMLIYNLPPSGQKALEEELQKLQNFEGNVGGFRSRVELEKIYERVHKWAYINLFQDAFRISPRIKGEGHLR